MKIKARKLISIIGIIFSFFILDFGYRLLLNNDLNYYSIFRVGPNLFSLAYIFLFIGILYLLNSNLRKIAYISFDIMFCMIAFIEYGQINYQIITVCLLSILVTLVNIFFMKEYKNKKNIYNYLFIILTSLICFIFCRGLAIMSLGPEVIRSSGEIDDSPKNIYIYNINSVKKQQVTGIYEYTFDDMFDTFVDNYNKNIKRINNKY